MLTGVRGVGKTTTARILARALNFETDEIKSPTLDLSQEGIHCPSIMEGNHVDVIEMDAASHTGIGDIREIIASVRYKPVSARYKVYIIDEVHMLSTAAFNGLLKTLEEPPEHVKFIFATTEIRKVPITVLSRCQRFDLRRIEAGEMTAHLSKIAGLENIEAEDEALAMIARAGEGSVRDALSLLDQAIAHSAGSGGGKIEAVEVRQMLGLADRARVIDLFEHVMKGDISAALAEIKEQYDVGADPATVLTDLAEFVHFVTRVRYVDTALNDPSLSEEEKTRGKAFAEKLSPRILGRAWQMLLKGISEVQASSRPLAAADMVLVRITHAADLPTPDEALKALADGGKSAGTVSSSAGGSNHGGTHGGGGATAVASGSMNASGSGTTMKQVANGGPALVVDNQPSQMVQPQTREEVAPPQVSAPDLKPVFDKVETFQDLLNLAEKKRDIRFKLMLRNNFSQIEFAPGRIEFCPVGNPPKDIVQILQARLREWTGEAWDVQTSEAVGEATIKEVEVATREKHFSDAAADPTVAAVLKAFPKSKIVDVRFPNADATDGLDESAVLEAALENPDANEDIDDDNALEASNEAGDPGAGGLDDYF
jgi:DNA polymerase-3 subunit gamma/tau